MSETMRDTVKNIVKPTGEDTVIETVQDNERLLDGLHETQKDRDSDRDNETDRQISHQFLRYTADQKESFKFTSYYRGCHEVASSEPDEGEVDLSEFENEFDDMIEWINDISSGVITASLDKLSGTAKYCSADSCGSDVDAGDLSGVATTLPSLMMLGMLLAVHLF